MGAVVRQPAWSNISYKHSTTLPALETRKSLASEKLKSLKLGILSVKKLYFYAIQKLMFYYLDKKCIYVLFMAMVIYINKSKYSAV